MLANRANRHGKSGDEIGRTPLLETLDIIPAVLT
jgi:hypothetical protein